MRYTVWPGTYESAAAGCCGLLRIVFLAVLHTVLRHGNNVAPKVIEAKADSVHGSLSASRSESKPMPYALDGMNGAFRSVQSSVNTRQGRRVFINRVLAERAAYTTAVRPT